MGNRSGRWASITSTYVGVLLLVGIVAPHAQGKNKTNGVPPGVPFQALQEQIDALDARIDSVESLAGLMWINTLDSRAAGASVLTLDLAGPGLRVAGAADDVLQVALQVPLGFAVKGVRVCYVSGAQSFISNVSLLQYAVPPVVPPAAPLDEDFTAPTANTVTCIDTTPLAVPVDPSSGPVYLSMSVAFPVADAITIRGIGLDLVPAP